MPNGHGGVPRFGAPLLIAGIAVALYFNSWFALSSFFRPVLLVLAAGFGWKLAEHMHFWGVLEYGGSMVTPEEASRARLKMILGSVAYASIAGLVVLLLTG